MNTLQKLSQPCDNFVTTLQGCSKVATTKLFPYGVCSHWRKCILICSVEEFSDVAVSYAFLVCSERIVSMKTLSLCFNWLFLGITNVHHKVNICLPCICKCCKHSFTIQSDLTARRACIWHRFRCHKQSFNYTNLSINWMTKVGSYNLH